MGTRKIFNIKTIKDKKYNSLNLGAYTGLFGKCESCVTIMLYGHSGSGKSVFALQLADYLAKNVGKTLYNSHEEGINETLQNRVNAWNIDAKKLFVAKALTFDEMMMAISRNYYRVVVIDSVQYMRFKNNQLEELRKVFSKRKIVVIMVSFGNKLGVPADGENGINLLHASDVKCFFKGGKLHVTSRNLDKIVEKTLFGGDRSCGQQLSLF